MIYCSKVFNGLRISRVFLAALVALLLNGSVVLGSSSVAAFGSGAVLLPEWPAGVKYRNLFLELGYSAADIDKKVEKAYTDLFEGPAKIYFEVGDSMGYVSDLKNRDVRTEGMSYGMMVAVQFNKKEVFDRLWRFSKFYLQHQEGPREAYFAWSFNPATMKRNSQGSASDGELYYITSLLFASNLWGNDTGIDYYGEARRILDAMWKKDGTGNIYPLINLESKQISFVPEGSNYNWTDPSYHLPSFYEVWAAYAKDGHEQFYLDCADTSRVFLKRACHPVTGLNTDYTEFSGAPHSTPWMPAAFRYDSWRVPMNIAMDYIWCGKDKVWQESYGKKIRGFLFSQGLETFVDQYNPDGTKPEFILQAGGFRKLRHSIGLKATAATTSLMGTDEKGYDFVRSLWNAKLEPYEDGYFDPYYDGLLYLFSLMHLSGKYQIIAPVAPVVATPSAPDPDFHIYLCLGQSNMEGNARIQPQDLEGVDPRFKVLSVVDCPQANRKAGNWYTALPPLCRCGTGLTPADYFGRALVSALPARVKVGVVMVAIGGCKIELFNKAEAASYMATAPGWMKGMIAEYGGDPYARLVTMAKEAQKSGVIKGILLHQGESNTNDSLWLSKVSLMYHQLLTDLHLDAAKVPLLAGEVVNADQGGVCAGMNGIIAKLPQVIPTAHVISSKGCLAAPDHLHFNAEGYRLLGKRYADTMLAVMGVGPNGSM